ncbi:hypothetical protein CALCODRAFT_23369 [Calocera cornea HHB12733]|uniref:Uncharacterized protein n=1 Tax=Calocera cornea HHB12733 TaxID=1353952 RepID=A0A165E450_9BASI|nr:hypothetical protein CALCODRAFT_23369 [Calocera cornea HHB12733]
MARIDVVRLVRPPVVIVGVSTENVAVQFPVGGKCVVPLRARSAWAPRLAHTIFMVTPGYTIAQMTFLPSRRNPDRHAFLSHNRETSNAPTAWPKGNDLCGVAWSILGPATSVVQAGGASSSGDFLVLRGIRDLVAMIEIKQDERSRSSSPVKAAH